MDMATSTTHQPHTEERLRLLHGHVQGRRDLETTVKPREAGSHGGAHRDGNVRTWSASRRIPKASPRTMRTLNAGSMALGNARKLDNHTWPSSKRPARPKNGWRSCRISTREVGVAGRIASIAHSHFGVRRPRQQAASPCSSDRTPVSVTPDHCGQSTGHHSSWQGQRSLTEPQSP